MLQCDPVFHCTKVISEVQFTGRLDPAEYSRHLTKLRVDTLTSQREVGTLPGHLLAACVDAARIGADYIRSRSADRNALVWQQKGHADFVSEVDTGAEACITDALLAAVPDARVVAEEGTPRESWSSGIAFIVDPLDGTTNFLHGYEQYAVSIAALADGLLCAAFVVHVPRNIVYTAAIGRGAHRDGQRMSVSATTDPQRSLIGTGIPFREATSLEQYLPLLVRVASGSAGIRRAGAAALDLADVADGRLDGFWELSLAPWDIAAGLLLIREAGGRVTDLDGIDALPAHTPVVASNSHLHPWLLSNVGSGPKALI